jgi:hypothetical protein
VRTSPTARALAFLCLVLSCGGAQREPQVGRQEEAKLPECPALRYLPLVDGNQWAYDAEEDETGDKGMFVTRARRLPGPRFSLVSTQGSHTVEVRGDGITRVETDAYLLKTPLTAGAEWLGEHGSTVRVASADRMVEVPAGKFVGCVETVEEDRGPAGRPARRVTTTYCPDVGVTLLHAEAWRGGKHLGEHASLRSFGRPVQFDDKSR